MVDEVRTLGDRKQSGLEPETSASGGKMGMKLYIQYLYNNSGLGCFCGVYEWFYSRMKHHLMPIKATKSTGDQKFMPH